MPQIKSDSSEQSEVEEPQESETKKQKLVEESSFSEASEEEKVSEKSKSSEHSEEKSEQTDTEMDEESEKPVSEKAIEIEEKDSSDSVQIIEVVKKDEFKLPEIRANIDLNMQSLSSSCNNSQALEIKNRLEIGAKNDEFSFNGGGCISDSKKSGKKMSPKKNRKSEQEEILEVTKDDELLEIQSESSSVRDMRKNISGNEGPSWTKSYTSVS